jgi:hypothetical protein
MPVFIDAQGARQDVKLDVTIYKEAEKHGMSVSQYLNRKYPTNAEREGTAFEQFMASCGLFFKADRAAGIKPPTMHDIIHGQAELNFAALEGKQAGVIVQEAQPASRIIFPAVFLEAIENALHTDYGSYVGTFNSLIAVDDSINSNRFEQPLLDYSRVNGTVAQPISQLAEPAAMIGITISDVARKIPSFSLGLQVSFEAMKATTLDLVAMAMTRQAEYQQAFLVDGYIQSFLNGDVDMGSAPLPVTKASDLDPAITTAGTLTHLAWVTWLRRNFRRRHIDWVFCDLKTALAIENRIGRPVITQDDPNSPRINPLASVTNPQWQDVKIFLMEDGVLPSGTIMGIDSRYAIRRVRNAQAQYSAVEQYVMSKSEALRWDFGEVAYRMFDEAFEVLQLQ